MHIQHIAIHGVNNAFHIKNWGKQGKEKKGSKNKQNNKRTIYYKNHADCTNQLPISTQHARDVHTYKDMDILYPHFVTVLIFAISMQYLFV